MSHDTTIDREVLKIVFDVAVNSLDFGSGFLDDEEVTALRSVAVVLGVDPMTATPDMFKCKYENRHLAYPPPDHNRCSRCKQETP
jgi:hypothetical protein